MTLQEPTCRGVRVKTLDDARLIFHAVYLGKLPMVTRRLSSEERSRIRPGDVYVWEEKTQHHVEQAGLSIERWTDCFAWGPSRVRDEFLFYTQKEREYRRSNNRRNDMPPQAPGERWHKQTLSVIVKDPRNSSHINRKWHMTAYFHRDNLPGVHEALVGIPLPPPGMYEKARSTRATTRQVQEHSSMSPSSDEGSSSIYAADAAYGAPGSPIRSYRQRHRTLPYPPPSPSSSSSSGRRLSISSLSAPTALTPIVPTHSHRPSLPPLPVPRGPHPSLPYPPPGADLNPDGTPYHLRPFGEPFPPVSPAPEVPLTPPVLTTRTPEFALSLDGPVKADGKRIVLGVPPMRGTNSIFRRREDEAMLRMFH
ncbi:hypothetical protein AURDEDRAFT_110294, partial [Auricularia subglabra TFB-10046 SS5]